MATQHEWRERLEDGRLRRVRAVRDSGGWRLSEKFEEGERWVRLDPPGGEVVARFYKVLRDKYRRRRAPYEHVLEVERMLAGEGRRDE